MADINPFVRFVVNRLGLDEATLPNFSQVTDAGNTVGSISVRLGLINVFDIDAIIDVQRNERHRRFGEIAIQLGLLSEADVEGVLELQQFYRALEPAVLLVISQKIKLTTLLALWSDFVKERTTFA